MEKHITWEKLGDTVVFRFHGSIESEITSSLRQEIIQVLRDEHSDSAVFQMADVSYIDSMGFGMFVHLHVKHRDHIRFVFCCLSDVISKAFGNVKLISFFSILDDLEDALGELNIAQH
jgi:anti-anti-sigma factor